MIYIYILYNTSVPEITTHWLQTRYSPPKDHLLNDAWKWAVRDLSAASRHEYWPRSLESHERIAVRDERSGEPATIVANFGLYHNVRQCTASRFTTAD